MKPKLFDAVHALVGGQVSGGSKYPASYRFHDGQTPPTEKAVTDKLAELEADYDAKEYQRDRIYPEVTDQLDMIYWDKKNSTDLWKEAIDKVKSDNPKP